MQSETDCPEPTVATCAQSVPSSDTREVVISAASALGALLFLVWRAHGFFPNANGFLGHDYSWFLPTLLIGHFWHHQNGWLTPPDFTPAFCGGIPFLANPQSVFFSLPQLLMSVFEPTSAMFATLVVSSTVGAAGSYVLLRRHFGTSVSAATLGATLFLLNGFVFYRMVIGHLSYHAVGVLPLLACVVASAQRTPSTARASAGRSCLQVIFGGLLIAYLTYGGALNFQIPAVLTVASTLLMLQTTRGFQARPWAILAGSCLWGSLISAMKLVPAIVFAGQFPRSYIPDYLFTDPVQMAIMLGVGFFAPAALPDGVAFAGGGGLGRHEFEYGLSIVPLWLMCLAIRRRTPVRATFGRRIQWAALAALLLIPVVLTFGPREWGVFLLQVPVLNSNTTFVRWWGLYLLPLVVAAARCFDIVAPTTSRRCVMLVMCAAVVVGQEAGHNAPYYTEQTTARNAYDPEPITRIYGQIQQGIALPRITRIGSDTLPGSARPARANEAFIQGASAWPCYEPLFGYKLESLPRSGVVKGSVTLPTADGRLNLVDPSNYLVGRNRPSESWRFDESREAAARLFADYRPYEWNRPWWHKAASIVTLAALTVSLAGLACAAWLALLSGATARRRVSDGVA